ncbi:MAG: glycerol-3-phosphate 1-O-acyltransferase PlsY [Candidatus Symbiobacter sp.]|nr:glycerol-3-phosphate 1-O-acyltransferase PlsY [Candidatus Symbiobacter sp.]
MMSILANYWENIVGLWAYELLVLIYLVLAYLLGSIPFGLLLTKMSGAGDIRAIGSGNIGATNVLRTGRKGLAALTLLLDAAKGAAAILLLPGPPQKYYYLNFLLGIMVIIGHIFPIWLRGKGGKGVATFLGVWLAFMWPIGLASCVTWLLTAVIFRYSSLASLVAVVASMPFLLITWFIFPGTNPANSVSVVNAIGIIILITIPILLVVWRHKENIRRLWRGEESRIKFSKSKS